MEKIIHNHDHANRIEYISASFICGMDSSSLFFARVSNHTSRKSTSKKSKLTDKKYHYIITHHYHYSLSYYFMTLCKKEHIHDQSSLSNIRILKSSHHPTCTQNLHVEKQYKNDIDHFSIHFCNYSAFLPMSKDCHIVSCKIYFFRRAHQHLTSYGEWSENQSYSAIFISHHSFLNLVHTVNSKSRSLKKIKSKLFCFLLVWGLHSSVNNAFDSIVFS